MNEAEIRRCLVQTWSSRDLSLGLETPFLQVLVSVLVLNLGVLVLVLVLVLDKQVLNPSLVWL